MSEDYGRARRAGWAAAERMAAELAAAAPAVGPDGTGAYRRAAWLAEALAAASATVNAEHRDAWALQGRVWRAAWDAEARA